MVCIGMVAAMLGGAAAAMIIAFAGVVIYAMIAAAGCSVCGGASPSRDGSTSKNLDAGRSRPPSRGGLFEQPIHGAAEALGIGSRVRQSVAPYPMIRMMALQGGDREDRKADEHDEPHKNDLGICGHREHLVVLARAPALAEFPRRIRFRVNNVEQMVFRLPKPGPQLVCNPVLAFAFESVPPSLFVHRAHRTSLAANSNSIRDHVDRASPARSAVVRMTLFSSAVTRSSTISVLIPAFARTNTG
jgi:hypothetical protein